MSKIAEGIVFTGLSLLVSVSLYEIYTKYGTANPLKTDNVDDYLDKGYYIHFTNNPNIIGINSKRSLSTAGGPLGLYCYEWKKYLLDSGAIRFAADRKFALLLSPISSSNILETKKYSEKDFENDISKLRFIADNDLIDKALKRRIKFIEANLPRVYDLPAGKLYYVLSKLTDLEIDPDDPIPYGDNSVINYRYMSKLFLDLGYTGFTDHYGIIWASEVNQTVFFTMDKLYVKGIFEVAT